MAIVTQIPTNEHHDISVVLEPKSVWYLVSGGVGCYSKFKLCWCWTDIITFEKGSDIWTAAVFMLF